MTDIHSCSYYCDRPACIKAQRNELRDKMAQPEQEPDYNICPKCGGMASDPIVPLEQRQPAPVQEPVARVIDNGTPEGATEWIPFTNRVEPLKTGDLLYTTPQPQREWVGLMRGVRVDGDNVVISVKGGNDVARHLCGELLKEKNT